MAQKRATYLVSTEDGVHISTYGPDGPPSRIKNRCVRITSIARVGDKLYVLSNRKDSPTVSPEAANRYLNGKDVLPGTKIAMEVAFKRLNAKHYHGWIKRNGKP